MRQSLSLLSLLSFSLLFLLYFNQANADDAAFHPPQTGAEKALDKILRLDIEKRLGNYFFNHPLAKAPDSYSAYDPAKAIKYSSMFTDALQESWQQAELEEESNPDAAIDEDVIACMDFNPEFIAPPTYKTIETTTSSALIKQSYPDDATKKFYPDYTHYPANTYRMIKDHGNWKLDAINCNNTYKFNML